LRYHAGLAVAIVAISFTSILIRLADSPALTIATVRMVLAVLLLLPALLLLEWRELATITHRELQLCALSGLFLALHFWLWTASLSYTSVASSLVLVSTHPVIVAVLAYLLFQERLKRSTLLGILLTFGGTVLIGINDLGVGPRSLHGDLLAGGGSLAMVGYLLIGKAIRSRRGFLTYSVLVYASCALVLTGAGLGLGVPLLSFSGKDLLLFLGLAVLTLAGHTVFNWALKQVGASVVAVSFVGEPAGSAFLAWLILGEPLTLLTAAGGSIMLLGIYVAARSR